MASLYDKTISADDKKDLVQVNQLIDLTEAPVGLTQEQISYSRVKSTNSNCICCCLDNSITLVTTDDSYCLNHVPLDNILAAQVSPSLQHLALSNQRKLAVVDLVDVEMDLKSDEGQTKHCSSNPKGEVKVVNLAAHGITMGDVIFWRWLDDTTLAILSYETLYVCSLTQPKISHPAFTAFLSRSRQLSMQKVFDVHRHLTALCQVTDIKRDSSGDIFAVSSLYTTSSLIRPTSGSSSSATLKSSFGSVPGRLSQLVNFDQSFDSIRSEQMFETNYNCPQSGPLASNGEEEVYGLVQIHSRFRDQSQLIQSHAITFTQSSQVLRPHQANGSRHQLSSSTDSNKSHQPTILVAANKIDTKLRVHFVEMATPNNNPPSGFNAPSTTRFNWKKAADFPTAIHCSTLGSDDGRRLQVAMITTKHGQLYVYSVLHATILLSTTITSGLISSSVVESKTRGLMVICRNGQVLLVRLNLNKLIALLDSSKTLRHISSSHSIVSTLGRVDKKLISRHSEKVEDSSKAMHSNDNLKSQLSASLDAGLEILISTKL